MIESKNTNHKLNLLKGLACMGVVFIHITFPGMLGQVVLRISDYAVPIFYMIAGYYAWNKDTDVIKRRLIKIIRIFLAAYVLYLLYAVIFAVKNHELGVWLSENFNLMTPIRYICFCTIDFAMHLWYLAAMIEVYCVWYFFVKKKREQLTVKAIPFLFVLQILLTTICDTMQLEWFWKVNFVTCAMPWFLLGYFIHTCRAEKLRRLDKYKLVLLSAAGCIIALVPTVFGLSIQFNVAGYVPYALGLFLIAVKEPNKSICRPLEYIGERLSPYIYIIHIIVRNITDSFLGKFIDTSSGGYLWLRPIFVLVCSIAVSWILYLLYNNVMKNIKSDENVR